MGFTKGIIRFALKMSDRNNKTAITAYILLSLIALGILILQESILFTPTEPVIWIA